MVDLLFPSIVVVGYPSQKGNPYHLITTSVPENTYAYFGCKGLIIREEFKKENRWWEENRQQNPACLTLLLNMTEHIEDSVCKFFRT
jgi:hypothetical protein